MLQFYHEVQFDGNRFYKLDLNKLEKPYLDAYMSQISSKSVQRFERRSRNVFNKDRLLKS